MQSVKKLKKLHALNNNIGKGVFIAGYSTQAIQFGSSSLEIFTDGMSLKSYLDKNSASNYADLTVIHGTLTKAITIPADVDKCLDIFVIIPYANVDNDNYIVKCRDLDHLQQVIIKVTSEEVEEFPAEKDFEVDDDDLMLDIDTKDIEDLYILYGYELELYFSFKPEDLDLILLDESAAVYDNLKDE